MIEYEQIDSEYAREVSGMYGAQLIREEDRRRDNERSYGKSMGAAIAVFLMGGFLFADFIWTRIQQGLGFSSPFLLTVSVITVGFLGTWLLITYIVIKVRFHRGRTRERVFLIRHWAAEELQARSQGLTYGNPFPIWWWRHLSKEVRRAFVDSQYRLPEGQ